MSNCSEQCAREHLVVLMGEERDATAHEREIAIDTYAAAVSRARDAAWREAVEAVRKNENHHDETRSWIATACNAALDALLARMDTARAGGANG